VARPARTAERIDLPQLSELLDLCRAKGVISFELTLEGYKILLGPPPPPKTKPGEVDPFAQKRAAYLDQLGRTLTDAELKLLP